jgi:hypothetical protein
MKGKAVLIVSLLLFSMVFVDTARAQGSEGVKAASIDYEIEICIQAKADLVVPLEYQFVYPGGSFYLKVSPVDAGARIGLEYFGERQADKSGIAGPFFIGEDISEEELEVTVDGEHAGSIKVGEEYTIGFVNSKGDALDSSSYYYTRKSIPEGEEFYVKVTSKEGAVADATVGYRDPKSDKGTIIETKKTDSKGVAGPYTLWISATTDFTFVAYKKDGGDMGACEEKAQVRDTISTPMTPEELEKEIEEALPMPPQLTGNVTQDVYAWLEWWYNNFVFYGETTRLGYGDLFAIKNWTQIVRDLPQLISKFPKYWVDPVGAVVGTRYMVDVFRELFKLIPALASMLPLIIETAPKRMLSLYPSIWMRLPNMLKGINQAVVDTAILMLSVAPAFMEIMPEMLGSLPDAIPKAGDILLNTTVILLQSIPAAARALPAVFLAVPAFLMLMFMATFIMLPEFVVRIVPIEIPKILTRLFALWPMYTTGIAAAFMAGAPMMMYFEPGIIIPAIGRTVESTVATGQNIMGALRRMPSELLGPTLSGVGSALFSINFAVGLIWMVLGLVAQPLIVLPSVFVGGLILLIIVVFFVLPAVFFFVLGLLSIIPPFSWIVGGLSSIWMLGSILISSAMAVIYVGVTIGKLCVLDPIGSIVSAVLKPTIDRLTEATGEIMQTSAKISGEAIESATEGSGIIDTIAPLLASLGSFTAGAAGGAAVTGGAAAVTPL